MLFFEHLKKSKKKKNMKEEITVWQQLCKGQKSLTDMLII